MKRSFSYLVVLTILALAAVVVFTPGEKPPGTPGTDALLLPEIAAQINDVSRVEIVSAGNQTVATLIKSENFWKLQQMGGYQADWPKLQALLAGLAQARVIETKTDKAEYYARLGVEDVASEGAGSVLVKLGSGENTSAVLIGHSSQGRQGQYVRLQSSTASVLVDREFDVPTDTLGWIQSGIIDIGSSEVAEVEIIHPQGERVLITRISADQTDFDLVGLPEGREIKSSWAVNSLGAVLTQLKLESVRADDGLDWTGAVKMRVLMFSGVEIIADLLEVEETNLLRLRAAHPDANVARNDQADSSDDIEQQNIEQRDIEQRAAEDVAKTVNDINERVAGWVYGISRQKYDTMVSQPEDLLKPLEST